MNYKYLVQIFNDDGTLKNEIKFKTKKEIREKYNLDLQRIDRIIELSNTNLKLKLIHKNFEELYKQIKIILIKSKINIE